jgi:hypothetical protein
VHKGVADRAMGLFRHEYESFGIVQQTFVQLALATPRSFS